MGRRGGRADRQLPRQLNHWRRRPTSGSRAVRSFRSFQVGDLNAANVLGDLRGSLWLIDLLDGDPTSTFSDAAKMVAALLFEYFPIPLSLDEVREAPSRSSRTRGAAVVELAAQISGLWAECAPWPTCARGGTSSCPDEEVLKRIGRSARPRRPRAALRRGLEAARRAARRGPTCVAQSCGRWAGRGLDKWPPQLRPRSPRRGSAHHHAAGGRARTRRRRARRRRGDTLPAVARDEGHQLGGEGRARSASGAPGRTRSGLHEVCVAASERGGSPSPTWRRAPAARTHVARHEAVEGTLKLAAGLPCQSTTPSRRDAAARARSTERLAVVGVPRVVQPHEGQRRPSGSTRARRRRSPVDAVEFDGGRRGAAQGDGARRGEGRHLARRAPSHRVGAAVPGLQTLKDGVAPARPRPRPPTPCTTSFSWTRQGGTTQSAPRGGSATCARRWRTASNRAGLGVPRRTLDAARLDDRAYGGRASRRRSPPRREPRPRGLRRPGRVARRPLERRVAQD